MSYLCAEGKADDGDFLPISPFFYAIVDELLTQKYNTYT